jgi:hypothetical protein
VRGVSGETGRDKEGGRTDAVSHRFKLDTSRHSARNLRRLDRLSIDLLESPEEVVGVAEDPDAKKGQLLEGKEGRK